MKRVWLAALLIPSIVVGCDLGPYPDFLDALDRLESTKSDGTAWISISEQGTSVLVLSADRYLVSTVGVDTAVTSETGEFTLDGDQAVLRPSVRYFKLAETGPVSQRQGAQSEPVEEETRELMVTMTKNELTLEGLGRFVPVGHFLTGLELESEEGRGCLLKFLQVTLKTTQARIRNLGGGSTAIYRDNETSFDGFVDGEVSILLSDLLSPKTSITYHALQDLPELTLDGQTVTSVSTTGTGTQLGAISFSFEADGSGADGSGTGGSAGSAGGAGGASGVSEFSATGTIRYGAGGPIEIDQSDPVGGNYGLELATPVQASSAFPTPFLQLLDLTTCQ